MFDYNISKNASNSVFKQACGTIECGFDNLVKDDILIDVDGSLVQSYFYDGKAIHVHNDYEVGAVYALSEVRIPELDQYLLRAIT